MSQPDRPFVNTTEYKPYPNNPADPRHYHIPIEVSSNVAVPPQSPEKAYKRKWSDGQKAAAGIAGLVLTGIAAFGVATHNSQDRPSDAGRQPDVPVAVNEKDDTLRLSSEQQRKVNTAATKAALSRIEMTQEALKNDEYLEKPYMYKGAFNINSYQLRKVKGKSYDTVANITYITATPGNTIDGLEMRVAYSESDACFKGENIKDCEFSDRTDHVLNFVNPESKVFDDRKLTTAELKKYLEDSRTVFTEGSKHYTSETNGKQDYSNYQVVEIKDGVVSAGYDARGSLDAVTNVE